MLPSLTHIVPGFSFQTIRTMSAFDPIYLSKVTVPVKVWLDFDEPRQICGAI